MNLEDGWSYQLRYVRCGKSGCRSCSTGFGHGPYWYAYRRIDGRVRSRYVGKDFPTAYFDRKTAPPPKDADRWTFRGRMDAKTALRILGFTAWPDQPTLRKRWAVLVQEHHPDRGGSTQVCAAINVAYGYLRR